MGLGMLFFVIAAIILFLGGIGATMVPNPMIWGVFCIALGLLLWDTPLPYRR